jgi:hypothetical protein
MASNAAVVYGSKAYADWFRPACEVKDLCAQVETWNQKISTLHKDTKLLFKISLINTLAMGVFATCLAGLGLGAFFFSAGSAAALLLELQNLLCGLRIDSR